MQPQPGGYTPYGYNPGANAYTPNPPPAGGYPPPNPNAYPQPQPGGYSPYGNGEHGYQPPQQPPSYVPPGYGGPVHPQGPMAHGGGFGHPGQHPGQPIVAQPQMGDGGWMNIPQGIPNCPPGLEYLTTIDQLLVKQKVELLEAFTGFETNNKFTIKNSLGQKVYWAVEENDCCTRNCCGPSRPFEMKVMDTYKNTVISLNRPLACDKCCFPCCLQSMEVSAPPGSHIGTIEQEWSIFSPSFRIKNAAGEVVLRIEGPFCTFSLCGDVEFKIVTLNGDQVGKISKQWSGLAREMFTDADFFGITFPMDLDVHMKATMLGACFLIDAMFFEKSGNQENDRPGMF